MVVVEKDRLLLQVGQNPLHRAGLLEDDESEVGHARAGRRLLALRGALVADADVGHLAPLAEQVPEVLLRAVVRQVAHEQLLHVRVLRRATATHAPLAAAGGAWTAARGSAAHGSHLNSSGLLRGMQLRQGREIFNMNKFKI